MSQAEQLELQTRAFSFGQDMSKLYPRVGDDEGKKRWRVEFAATEKEKEVLGCVPILYLAHLTQLACASYTPAM